MAKTITPHFCVSGTLLPARGAGEQHCRGLHPPVTEDSFEIVHMQSASPVLPEGRLLTGFGLNSPVWHGELLIAIV